MNRTSLLFALCGTLSCLLAVGASAGVQQEFHVSPSGDDAQPGTSAKPFRAIERARDAVRAVNGKMTGDVVVVLHGGTYALERTLVLDHRDSGTNGHYVVYRGDPGEAAVLSGAKAIRGWQPTGGAGGQWQAHTDIDNFRQLHVDGARAVRARGKPPRGIELFGENGYKTAQAEMADWANPQDIELCYQVVWTHTRCKIQSITREGSQAVINMLQPYFTLARTKEGVHVGLPSYMENALELLDAPGEWYLDRKARTVYYLPRPGEDMRSVAVLAPALEKLVDLRGEIGQPVCNVRFEGLTFADATWLQPSRIGHPDVQANFLPDPAKPLKRMGTVTTVHNENLKSPGAVVCRAARSVRFERCTFTRLGGGGLDIEYGSQDNAVVGCRFHDVSGTAVQVGDVLKDDHHPDDPRKTVRNNTIANNAIGDCCLEYKGGVGVFVGYTDGTVIAHNEISRLPYTGVSVGWGWGEEDAGGGAANYTQPFRYKTPTPAGNNRIEYNHIHHVMRELSDGGGIYTLSNQPGTVIRGNHVHDNRGAPGGIYLDEGSGFIQVTGNAVYAVPRPMNYNNAAQNRRATCKEHDNFFGVKPGEPGFPREATDQAGVEPAWRDKLPAGGPAAADADAPPALACVSDYDGGDYFWVRHGRKQPQHGIREAWVFNRAMTWLDDKDGVQGAIICYSSQSPLLLTGKKQVSRWFTSKANELADVDDDTTRFVKKDPKAEFDHALLPAFQFHVEQDPTAELEVTEATHPWQLIVAVKGRGGPPLYAGPWQDKPGKLTVELLKLYRAKGYRGHFAELTFALFVHTKDPKDQARLVFRLRLNGREAIISSLPVIRTAERAKAEGVPVYAVVLDERARPLGKTSVRVSAVVGEKAVELAEDGSGIWKTTLRGVPVGSHRVRLVADWPMARKRGPVETALDVHITDGRFIGYDPKLKLLTEGGKPIGPFAGSYRGAPMFKGIGTPAESLVQGQEQWAAVQGTVHEGQHLNHGGPRYGFHWWESLTDKEIDADYAYLAGCGWSVVHLCQGWWLWERLDAGGRIAPHGAEQLAAVTAAARRHGLHLHFALSHYPLGKQSAPYAQYLEAGYQRGDYAKGDSKFYAMFKAYLAHFTTLFGDETGISGFTAAGEGDPDCGPTFVNAVHDFVASRDPNHLFLCEPHHGMRTDPRSYRKAGWKPLLGGMRTYFIDRRPVEAVAAQFRLAALGHVFMAEGIFWGYMGGPTQTDRYRQRVRETFYTGLALRNPIMMTWEERVVEDERQVLQQVRRAVDWSTPFQRPRLAVRVGNESLVDAGGEALIRYETALSRIPLDYVCVWDDEAVPEGTLFAIDARQPFAEPRFASDGGKLPDALKADMPLRLPPGFAADYSWSQDRRTLLAYLRGTAPAGHPGAPATTEAGHFTYIDTTRVIEADTLLEAWEVQCARPGTIQLHVYRIEGDQMIRVGEGETAEMKRPGLSRFKLDKPIAARKGDLVGFYIRDGDTHVAAEPGGRMLFIEGRLADARTPIKDWGIEPKIASIRAFNAPKAAGAASRPAQAPGAGGDMVLRNFPPSAGELSYRLFDLATRKAVLTGTFAADKPAQLALPTDARDLFLLVTPKR